MSKIQGYVRAKRYARTPGVETTDVLVGLRDTDGELRLVFTRSDAPAQKHWRSPLPGAIRKARQAAGLTQKQAAEKCFSSLCSWQCWEYGKRRMHPAIWQVFLAAIRAPAATLARTTLVPDRIPVRPARARRPQRESIA